MGNKTQRHVHPMKPYHHHQHLATLVSILFIVAIVIRSRTTFDIRDLDTFGLKTDLKIAMSIEIY